MKNFLIIGAGNLGSRHLQALKAVKYPLSISVVDSSKNSLDIARERYNSILPEKSDHTIQYMNSIPRIKDPIDICIIATSSNARKIVIQDLLEKNQVQYLILEKLLFQNLKDYYEIETLLKNRHISTWVNCPMRMVPFYRDQVKKWFTNTAFHYYISGSNYGLITNSIHYLDFMVFLQNSMDFEIDTKYLDMHPIDSKRSGFLELTGILQIHFTNGTHGSFQCSKEGIVPLTQMITSESKRILIKDTEQIALVWNHNQNPAWVEVEAKFPYQSQLTTILTEQLLDEGTCFLPNYTESVQIHLKLLEPLKKYFQKLNYKTTVDYPFT